MTFPLQDMNYWQKTILSNFIGANFTRYKEQVYLKKMIEYFDFDTLYEMQAANAMQM